MGRSGIIGGGRRAKGIGQRVVQTGLLKQQERCQQGQRDPQPKALQIGLLARLPCHAAFLGAGACCQSRGGGGDAQPFGRKLGQERAGCGFETARVAVLGLEAAGGAA